MPSCAKIAYVCVCVVGTINVMNVCGDSGNTHSGFLLFHLLLQQLSSVAHSQDNVFHSRLQEEHVPLADCIYNVPVS